MAVTAGGYGVEPGELDTHRTQVSGIADDLSQAAAAGQSATPLGSDAFGIIGQAFATMAQGAVSVALYNLETASQTARQLGDGVGRAGEAYRQADQGAVQRVHQVGEEL